MASTISIREVEKHAHNIYEAIIIIAKRARQINEENKQLYRQEEEFDDEYSDSEDEQNEEVVVRDYKKLPKPARIALESFLAGNVKYDYQVDSVEEEETA
ncbi:MAG: DNA-directed RNA polymerase subunit omega [bacterium]